MTTTQERRADLVRPGDRVSFAGREYVDGVVTRLLPPDTGDDCVAFAIDCIRDGLTIPVIAAFRSDELVTVHQENP